MSTSKKNGFHKELRSLRTAKPLTEEERLLQKFQLLKTLCEEYGIPFTCPIPLETLVLSIMRDKEPVMAEFAVVHKMSVEVLCGQLNGLIAKHFTPKRREATPEQSEGLEKRLRIFALMEIVKEKADGKRHWGGTAAAKWIAKENPELIPKQQTGSEKLPADAIYSQYRKDDGILRKQEEEEEARRLSFSKQWESFILALGSETAEHLCEPLARIPVGDYGNGELLEEWISLARQLLPKPTFKEFLLVITPIRELWIVAGQQLQAKAEAEARLKVSRPFYLSRVEN
ncbi:MAG: hypothetical protein K2Z81_09730 [Cyanobacteria bacterium]|nr:hypothetical protein [Cyanobacteriota bacterium]